MSGERTYRVDPPLRHKVGTCPACREYLWAEVTMEVHVGDPRLDADGSASVHACATPVAMTVAHECAGRDSA